MLNAGTTGMYVTFTYDNTIIATTKVPITVNKAIPLIQKCTASAITYGQSLNSSKVTGDVINPCSEVPVPGSFRLPAQNTVPPVSTKTYPVYFIPTDTNNYWTTQIGASVTVKKATPKVITPPVSTIKPGKLFKTFKITGGKVINPLIKNPLTRGVVAGSFVWSSPNAKVGPKGPYMAKFFPTDKANYNVSNPCSVKVKIASANLITKFFM